MKKVFFKSLLLSLAALLVMSSVVLAQTYEFVFPTTATDTSGSARTYLGTVLGYSGDSLVNAGKIVATGLDTNMRVSASDVKYTMAEGEVTAVAPTVPANGKVTFDLYTGYAPAQTTLAIVPVDSGYATLADAASLELGDNFTVEMDGYIDTSVVGDNKTYKQNAFRTYVSGTGNITSSILGSSWTTPTGFVDPSGNWNNETNAYDDNVVTFANHNNIASAWSGYLELTHAAVETSSVRVYAGFDAAGDAIEAIDVDAYYNAQWNNVYEGAPTIGAWATYWLTDPNSLVTSVRVRMEDQDAGNCFPYLYELDYGTDLSITAAGVSSGEHKVETYANTVNFTIEIDDVVEDTIALGGASVIDNANDWLLYPDPYWDYYKHTVNGALVTWYEPNTMIGGDYYAGTADNGTTTQLTDADLTQVNDYWNGARLTITDTTDDLAPEGETSVVTDFDAVSDNLTFGALTAAIDAGDTYRVSYGTLEDRQGANDAVLTWGTNTSLSITYGEMSGSGSSEASANETGGFDMPTSGLPATWFAGGEGAANLPFYDMILSVSNQTGQPVQAIYFLMVLAFAFGVLFLLTINTRAALFGVVGFNIVLFVGSSMTIVPMWIPFTVLIVQVGILYLYRQVAY